jgi:hypothetical protein
LLTLYEVASVSFESIFAIRIGQTIYLDRLATDAQTVRGTTMQSRLSSRSAPVWFGPGYGLREYCNMPFTAGVGSADEVFTALFVDF